MAPRRTLLQISDLHLLPEGGRLVGGLDPADGLARTLAAVRAAQLRPDALLLTGDLTESGDPASYRRLRALLEGVDRPWLPVMGNHDDRAALREHLLGERPDGDAAAPFDRAHRIGGLRIVVLDSSVPGRSHGELRPAQLAWLAAELAEPAPEGTVLAVHHPPLPSPFPLAAAIQLRDRTALARVLAGTDVRVVLSGHTHVVSAGALAGIPVWTGGSTSSTWDSLAPDRGARLVHTPAVTRIDLFDDPDAGRSVLVTAVPVDGEPVAALTAAQLDAIVARVG